MRARSFTRLLPPIVYYDGFWRKTYYNHIFMTCLRLVFIAYPRPLGAKIDQFRKNSGAAPDFSTESLAGRAGSVYSPAVKDVTFSPVRLRRVLGELLTNGRDS